MNLSESRSESGRPHDELKTSFMLKINFILFSIIYIIIGMACITQHLRVYLLKL